MLSIYDSGSTTNPRNGGGAEGGTPRGYSRKDKFDNDGDLFGALEKLNRSDLPIVRNHQGYAVWRDMPGPLHHAAVREKTPVPIPAVGAMRSGTGTGRSRSVG